MAVLAAIFLLASYVSLIAAETQIATFVDDSCQTSQQAFVAVDGYPDGLCMNIAKYTDATYGSFMLNSIDPGCTVTLYGNDTDDYICSATTLKTAALRVCVNSSWQYISADGCTNSSTSSNSLSSTTTSPTSVRSSTSSSSSAATSTTTSSDASSSSVSSSSSTTNVASASTTATSDQQTSSGSSKSHTGVIVGGIVGGLAVLAMLSGAYIWYRRRHSKARLAPDQQVMETDTSEKAELPPYFQIHEMEHSNKPAEAPTGFERAELDASPAVEMEASTDYPRTSFVVHK